MKFKVKEGTTKEGAKYVQTEDERGTVENVQRVEESVEEEWNRVELAQDGERVAAALETLLDGYKGVCR